MEKKYITLHDVELPQCLLFHWVTQVTLCLFLSLCGIALIAVLSPTGAQSRSRHSSSSKYFSRGLHHCLVWFILPPNYLKAKKYTKQGYSVEILVIILFYHYDEIFRRRTVFTVDYSRDHFVLQSMRTGITSPKLRVWCWYLRSAGDVTDCWLKNRRYALNLNLQDTPIQCYITPLRCSTTVPRHPVTYLTRKACRWAPHLWWL